MWWLRVMWSLSSGRNIVEICSLIQLCVCSVFWRAGFLFGFGFSCSKMCAYFGPGVCDLQCMWVFPMYTSSKINSSIYVPSRKGPSLNSEPKKRKHNRDHLIIFCLISFSREFAVFFVFSPHRLIYNIFVYNSCICFLLYNIVTLNHKFIFVFTFVHILQNLNTNQTKYV